MALLDKKIWGAFWRLLAQKRALSDSELLDTLNKNNNKDQKILNARWISHYFHILRNIFDTFLTFLKIYKKEEKWLIIKLEGYHN